MALPMIFLFLLMRHPTLAPQAENRFDIESVMMTLSANSGSIPKDVISLPLKTNSLYTSSDIIHKSCFFGKGQNIGTLKKREQGSMLLSSNYRRNSTYVANIG